MERLMQYIWQHRLWLQADMRTVDGLPVQVIDAGQLNTDSGPDFFNAKIKIGGRMWAGDVEIHVRASDWHRHGHDGNKAYDSVILHVVDRDDTVIRRSNGEAIPQMRMPCSPVFHQSYNRLVDRADRELPCAQRISDIPPIYITDWISTLAYERLHSKATHILELLKRFAGDWESVCYVVVARGLGFGVNGDMFERLALSLPLSFIGKHSDSLPAIEGLLFGQSGLLDAADKSDGYVASLQREYEFLSHKFGLKRPESLIWKMSRMRPANFPHRRIAILAAMLHGGFRMLSRVLDIDNSDRAMELFQPELTGYWLNHYCFGAPTSRRLGSLSRSSVTGLVINVVVPLQFAYATAHGNLALADRSVELLQSLPPEHNTITDMFNHAGIKTDDAFCTQAVIQLRRQYCEQRKCLFCRIGHRMLAAKARRRD